MSDTTGQVSFEIGKSYPEFPVGPCKKDPMRDMLDAKEARQLDLDQQRKRYDLRFEDNWVPVFTNHPFLPGECVGFEPGKLLESIGLCEGLYLPAQGQPENPPSGRLPLFREVLNQRKLRWNTAGKVDKVEEKSKLNRVHFLRSQLGEFKHLPDVRGKAWQSKLLHTVKRFRQVVVSLSLGEGQALKFARAKDVSKYRSIGVITAVVYHEARFGETERDDLSYSESITRESRTSEARYASSSNANEDSDGEQKVKEPRRLFLSFVQIREVDIDDKHRDILRQPRSFLSKFNPFARKQTSNVKSVAEAPKDPQQMPQISAEKAAAPAPKPAIAASSATAGNTRKELPKASQVFTHVWDATLAATMAESGESFSTQRPSLVFLLVRNLEALPPSLRNKLLPKEALSDAAVERWFASRLGLDKRGAVDAMALANEFRYNFRGDPIPETLRRNFFRPSAMRMEEVDCLAGCHVFAKNSPLEPLLRHLVNLKNFRLLDEQDCVDLFKLVARKAMSRPQCVDRYDAKRTRLTLVTACWLKQKSAERLKAFVEAGELAEAAVESEELAKVESIGQMFLHALGMPAEVRSVAVNLIKLWEFKLLEETACVRLFKLVAAGVDTDKAAQVRRILVGVKELRAKGLAKVDSLFDQVEKLEQVSVDAVEQAVKAADVAWDGKVAKVDKIRTVQMLRKVKDCGQGVQVWLCRSSIEGEADPSFGRCVVKRLPASPSVEEAMEVESLEAGSSTIAQSHRVITLNGDHFVAFPACVDTLETLLDGLGDVDTAERPALLRSIGASMAAAVAEVHAKGRVVGGLSLSSFGVTSDGKVKLLLAAVDQTDVDERYLRKQKRMTKGADLGSLGVCLFRMDAIQFPKEGDVRESLDVVEVEALKEPIQRLMEEGVSDGEAKHVVEVLGGIKEVDVTKHGLFRNIAAMPPAQEDTALFYDTRLMGQDQC